MKTKSILKRIALAGLLLVLVGIGVIYFLLITSPPNPPNRDFYQSVVAVEEVNGLSDEEIARKLFAKYLEHYKSDTIPEWERLTDYKVFEDITKVKTTDGSVYYAVGYSVKTYAPPGVCWAAGNGRMADDNWLLQKMYYIQIIREGEQYILKICGTGL